MLVPLRLAANARDLKLITRLDPRIDEVHIHEVSAARFPTVFWQVSRRAAYQAQGHNETWINEHLNAEDDEIGGLVVGDEMRLRQIVTNLASNACKFTQPGGCVEISTRLVYPPDSTCIHLENVATCSRNASTDNQTLGLSASRLSAHNSIESAKERQPRGITETPATLEQIVVHIEVTDTGVGIRARDLVDLRLFSPYVQTEIGRHQVRGRHDGCM